MKQLTIQATLVSSGRAVVTDPNHIVLLRSRGFYGYVPDEEHGTLDQQNEHQRQLDTDEESLEECDTLEDSATPVTSKCTECKQLFLTDVEILFLFHGLGCLDIVLPDSEQSETDSDLTNPLRLWYYLCSVSRLPSPPVHPTQARTELPQFIHLERDLLRRYAAYLYYRSRGWVVRPGLALGGVHFLLYAQGPAWRHAAFGVVVDRAEMDGQQMTCAALAVHVRVVHSVGKRLILCRVSLPDVVNYKDCPWDAIREATVVETLVDHWNPSCR
ncbi:tRNA-intron endonuclease [Clonorchis sinensis]|uniref:tRNA-intron lyase n=1 Tax=Clonorchis sinensis TaxID=79923 RepID=H2KTU6_CLOSI|nr:tRNA-intron endonuclease [Clonorchis sinensis]